MKLSVFVTHPVQYHVPLWRQLARHPSLDVHVHYFSDHSVRGGVDPGFGVPVRWDVDLLSGYQRTFESRDAELSRAAKVTLRAPAQLLRSERPDWVWLSGYTHGFERQLLSLSWLMGAKLIMRAEFSDSSEAPRSLAKRAARDLYLRGFYRAVDRFCYPGESSRQHLERLGVPGHKLFFSPYAVDDQQIRASRATVTREQERAALGIAEGSFVLLFSGKLIPRKNPLVVLDAIQRATTRAKLSLMVLGDGELMTEVRARAERLLGPRAHLPGFVNQSQLARYFSAADALVLPSVQETWGLVVNEAMHHGLPTLVSDGVGCRFDLVRPDTGFVHRVGAADELASHIDALASSPELTRHMGAAAARLVANYTVGAAANGVFSALGVPPLDGTE